MVEYNERLEARQEVLEDHNRRLENQLTKLRDLVTQVELSVSRKNNNHQQTPDNRKNHPQEQSGSHV